MATSVESFAAVLTNLQARIAYLQEVEAGLVPAPDDGLSGIQAQIADLREKKAREVATLADNLGDVQAQITDLRAKEADIKAALAEHGVSPIEGTYFRVTVSHIDGRDVTDWETIAKRFNPSRQLIAAHTKTGKPSVRVLCKARKAT